MAGKIFINYRRDDSIGMAGRLHDRLAQTFGRDRLFMDVDHIPVGVDFVAHLNSQVAECNALLVVIGPNWLNAKDESGERRLDNPDDFVAIEIAAALARDIRVIPVLVDGARMPKAKELPDSLKPLARRQAVDVRHSHFGQDAEALVKRMREALGEGVPVAREREALGDKVAGPSRWRVRATIGAAVVAVLLLIGWGGYAVVQHTYTTVEKTAQQREAAKAEQERQARAAAEADEKRKADEVKEARRKADEAERQRLADLKAEQERQQARAAAATTRCDNPNALGVSRRVEIDTRGGPGFGFEHFKAYDFLRDREIVLTFDDGPWPGVTSAVLKALADQCTKALFFVIGKHAVWHSQVMKQVAEQGHTVGTHTWSHMDLSKLSQQEGIAEIEKGIAAASIAIGNKPISPFFRFPALRHPPELLKYAGERNLGVFSTDMDSFDFKMTKPEEVIASVMKKLGTHGKGIILMHDYQQATAHAAPELLKRLKDGGYKVVQVVGKTPTEPKKEYVDVVLKEVGGGLETARPMSDVVR